MRLAELSVRHLDGVAEAAEFDELTRLLEASPENRQMFVTLSMQWRLVRHVISPQLLLDAARASHEAEAETEIDMPAARGGWRIGPVVGGGLIAAMLAIVATIVLWRTLPDGNNNRPVNTPQVALISDMQRVVWGTTGEAMDVGAELHPQSIDIRSGSLQVMFSSGAVVTLHGPVRFDLTDRNSGYLREGKLTAWVPADARGFTIAAPGAAVVDLGTEFAMSVDPVGGTQVHVFDGLVRTQLMDPKGRITFQRDLAKGQTAQLDAVSRTVTLIEAEPDQFYADQKINDAAYSAAVSTSKPWAYWPLVAIAGHGPLTDLGAAGHALKAAPTAAAQMHEHPDKSLQFDGQTILDLGNQGDWGLARSKAFTVEAWVWPGMMNTEGLVLLAEPGTSAAGWSLVYHPTDSLGGHMVMRLLGVNDLAFEDVRIARGRWTHVAVVVNESGAGELYVDGQARQSLPGRGSLVPSSGREYVKVGGRAAGLRWVGRLSHLSYFDRALSAQEIGEHYQSGEAP